MKKIRIALIWSRFWSIFIHLLMALLSTSIFSSCTRLCLNSREPSSKWAFFGGNKNSNEAKINIKHQDFCGKCRENAEFPFRVLARNSENQKNVTKKKLHRNRYTNGCCFFSVILWIYGFWYGKIHFPIAHIRAKAQCKSSESSSCLLVISFRFECSNKQTNKTRH